MSHDLVPLLTRLQSCRRLINISPAPVRVPFPSRSGAADGVGAAELLRRACESFRIAPLVPTPGEVPNPSGLERVVWRQLGLESDRAIWAGLAAPAAEVQAAIERVDRDDPRRRFQLHSIGTPRGAQLDVYECGPRERSSWLLALPYGVPAELCFDLAQEIAREYHFITFEGPDLIGDPNTFEACAHGIDESARDILAVMDHFELSRAHVAGLCAAAMPVLRFADLYRSRVASLILGNGSYATKSSSPLDFIALSERVGGQRKKAHVFFRFMAAQDLTTIEPEFPHLTMMPYSNPDLLYMFTTAFKRYYDRDLDSDLAGWLRSVDRPTLVVLGDCDKIVPPESSRRIAEQIKCSRVLADPEGTHLSLLRNPKRWMVDALLQFCREHD